MSVKIINFGCRLNLAETATIKEKATEAGLDKLNKDTFIFNTCAVTQEAIRQAQQSIRKIKKDNPYSNILVTGCGAQIDGKNFSELDEVDLVIGNEDKLHAHSYRALPEFGINLYEKLRVNDIMQVKSIAGHLIGAIDSKTRSFLQIQNGCDHRCTFCVIPYGRGPSRSVPMGVVVENIKNLVDTGTKEIVLTGVDLTSYGADLPGQPNLGKLIYTILKQVQDLPRLRISSIDSIEVDENLKELIIHEPRLMPHLHLSLQAGHNLILKRMKRRHLREDAIEFCQEIKSKRKDINFGADLIAGFPTENDEMFQATLDLIEECDLTFIHSFPYSMRPHTPAAKMPQVPRHIIMERAKILRKTAQAKLTNYLETQLGTQHRVLVEENSSGYSENYLKINIKTDHNYNIPKNTIVACEITGIINQQLIARLIN